MRSDNVFTKNRTSRSIIPTSSNTAVKNTISGSIVSVSSNQFTGNKQGQILPIAGKAWEGDNITDAPITDDLSSGSFGGDMYGGIRHFERIKDRT